MEQWEYLVIMLPGLAFGEERAKELTTELNRYGKLGWELVCVTEGCMLHFKRKK